MKCIVEAQGLSKSHGGVLAVDRLSFQVYENECFGILGRNGAGKTTLMRMIYCVCKKSGGALRVFDLDVDAHATIIKHRLGVVSQEESLDRDLSVRDNLLVYARFFGLSFKRAKKKIPQLLAFMGLEDKAHAPIRSLSGGMKRRLMILRALLNSPKLLVLDEPTIALDPQVRRFIWGKLKELQSLGLGVILATHYMEEAFQVCDRVMILDRGQALALGSPRELIAQHVKPFVLELGNAVHKTKQNAEVFARFLRTNLLEVDEHDDCVYVYAQDKEALEKLLYGLALHNSLCVRHAHLEDVFLKITGHTLDE